MYEDTSSSSDEEETSSDAETCSSSSSSDDETTYDEYHSDILEDDEEEIELEDHGSNSQDYEYPSDTFEDGEEPIQLEDFNVFEYAKSTSSESENDDSDDFIDETDKKKIKIQKIREWLIKTKQTRENGNELLAILREDMPELPKDMRTLIKEGLDQKTRNIVEMDDGKYIHIGLSKCLNNFLSKFEYKKDTIVLDICTDGVPVYKSSYSLWPILMNVVGYDYVLTIGTYYGPSKPKNCNLYFKKFVEEFLVIYESMFDFNGKKYAIDIRAIIADAPARAFLLNIKTFSGYNSCNKCRIKGLYILHRVTFPNLDCPLRTDDDFRNKTYENHHNNIETLEIEKLPIGCVSNVPIDYMHCVLLGVMNQILYACVMQRKKPYSIKSSKIRDLSSFILATGPQMSAEFCRSPSSLVFLKRYKAT